MHYEKYNYRNKSLRLIIEQDVVGFYLIIYKDPHSKKSSEDYLFDSLDEAFQTAKKNLEFQRLNGINPDKRRASLAVFNYRIVRLTLKIRDS